MNLDTPSETLTPVRDVHRFDEAALAAHLRSVSDEFNGAIAVRQFAGGQSNPTFLLESGGRKYVLRKKPPGKLLQSAHQVDREYRVMKALDGTDVPVPRMVTLCMDDAVIGTAFYVMEYVTGRIFRDPQLPGVPPQERAAIYDSMNDVLAKLHNVDIDAVGLSDYGKPGNYYQRQIARWIKQYRDAQTGDVRSMEALIRWMPENIPADATVSIAHGDFRLENSIYHPTEPRMSAVLDWELSTIGHPLADLAYNCMGYHMISPTQGGLLGLDFKATGIPDEETYVRRYCERTGRNYPLANWNFYLSFAIFRLAAIAQGVYRRGLDGNASSEKAALYGNACQFLSDTAEKIAGIS